MASDHEDEVSTGSAVGMFEEPEGFYEAEKQPTFAEYTLLSGQSLRVRLVGFNPLWGHHLWNAGRTLATYLEQHADVLVKGRNILELGAAAGLPSLVAAMKGASKVVVTDYPDAELVENLRLNIKLLPESQRHDNIEAEGYLWGGSVEPLLAKISGDTTTGFDTLILGDLLFNHSEHSKLVKSVQLTLKRAPDAVALVCFTPYRPWLLQKDLTFFDLAQEAGFVVNKTFERVMEKAMFEEDPGVSEMDVKLVWD